MPARLSRALALPLLAVALSSTLAACGKSADQTVDVLASDDKCTLSTTTVDAGKTAFKFKNDSGDEAEAYVYTDKGDKVDEVEDIAAGTSRTLTVDLEAGSYEFACKPGSKDIRTAFTVQ
jgi:iron uptake system component EfeO